MYESDADWADTANDADWGSCLNSHPQSVLVALVCQHIVLIVIVFFKYTGIWKRCDKDTWNKQD